MSMLSMEGGRGCLRTQGPDEGAFRMTGFGEGGEREKEQTAGSCLSRGGEARYLQVCMCVRAAGRHKATGLSGYTDSAALMVLVPTGRTGRTWRRDPDRALLCWAGRLCTG